MFPKQDEMRTSQQLYCDDSHLRKHETLLQKQSPGLRASPGLQAVFQLVHWAVRSLEMVCARGYQKAKLCLNLNVSA